MNSAKEYDPETETLLQAVLDDAWANLTEQ
jgi:hypothetical protein